jgi:hypothetical protein
MKRVIVLFVFLAGILLFLPFCHAAEYDLTGIWEGYFKTNLGKGYVTLEMEQDSEGKVTGSWETVAGGYGTLSGKIKGRIFTFTFKQKNKNCSGNFSGRGKVSADEKQLKYSLSGSNCQGEQTGTGKVYLQE